MPLTLAPTSYFAILDRTWWGGGGGCHFPRLICPLNEIELRNTKKTERSRSSESNHIRFYYLKSHFDFPRAGQTKNAAFWNIKFLFLQITFELRKIGENAKEHRIPLVKTYRNIYILTPKGQLENLTLTT